MAREFNIQGLSAKEYNHIHYWLIRYYEKPELCCFCGENKPLQNALIHGKGYEKNPDNYVQLCNECHSHYDRSKWATMMAKEKTEGYIYNLVQSLKEKHKEESRLIRKTA